MPAHYAILYYTKSEAGFTYHDDVHPFPFGYCFREKCSRVREETERVPLTDIWYDVHRIRHRRDRDDHPCQLPLPLMERIIRIASNPGDLVFDGFLGTGSTVVAAKRLGRRYLGLDLDPYYLAITAKKLSRVFPEQLPLISSWKG